jgi:hypothetical protein
MVLQGQQYSHHVTIHLQNALMRLFRIIIGKSGYLSENDRRRMFGTILRPIVDSLSGL